MYTAFVVLSMFALPVLSILFERLLHPDAELLVLVGKWFVFWGVGVRLTVAGLRQCLHPEFTAQGIFHMAGAEALPIIKELGMANVATGVVALASLFAPSFVLPVALIALIFFGAAGFGHIGSKDRSANENVALLSDLFLFAILGIFAVLTLATSA